MLYILVFISQYSKIYLNNSSNYIYDFKHFYYEMAGFTAVVAGGAIIMGLMKYMQSAVLTDPGKYSILSRFTTSNTSSCLHVSHQ